MTEKRNGFYLPEQAQDIDPSRALLLEEVRPFTLPQHDTRTLFQDLYQFAEESSPRVATGLVIGRFQPLHFGQVYNWQMALATSEQIVIGIGSVNKKDEDNPFSADEREKMVRDALDEYRLGHRISKIVQLKDYDNQDDRWLRETLALTGNVDVVVGNNEWVNGIFEDNGLRALRPPLLEREIYEGRKFRQQLRAQGSLN